MAQNENISLSLANKIDILNKTQSVDARYGVYDNESDALSAMDSYGLDGRLVAVYTDKINGKVKVYKYNQVLHQLDPIDDQSLALTLEQVRTNDNTVEGVILGSEEFDKEGDRKAFAQIADVEDAVPKNISELINDAGYTTNTGTVTSVGLSVPTGFSVSGSPITSSGTLAVTYESGYQGYTTAEASKLSGIEAGADVTDATNVALAGAFMKSTDDSDDITEGTSNLFMTSAERTKLSNIEEGAQINVNADWDAISGDAQILNKPDLSNFVESSELSEVAFSGDYDDLTNKPTLLEIGETSTTAYRGDRGKTAYDHSQVTGNPHQTTLQQVVDTDGTVTDKPVEFKSATPDTSTVNINNERVRVENQTDKKAVEIRVNNLAFEQDGKKISIEPASIDDDYVVTVQAKNHTLAGLDDILSDAVDIDYDNADSGLTATNVQELGDELQANIEQEVIDRQLAIETAGFIQRTGTAISFDKWATYDSYSSPSSGNFSYDLTNAVIGMVQVSYHEDSVVPTFSQAGITVHTVGEYQPDIVNRVVFELIGASRILINITPM